MTKFKLSEIQANHILDMPLRRLTKLARTELEDEHKELLAQDQVPERLLKDPKKMRGVIKEELPEIRKKHADARRTADQGGRGRVRRRGPDRRGGRRHHRQPRRLREAPRRSTRSAGRAAAARASAGRTSRKRTSSATSSRRPRTTGCCSSPTRARSTASRCTRCPTSRRTARGLYAANLPGVAISRRRAASAP